MTRRDWESIFTLWDDLLDFDRSEIDGALHHLFDTLAHRLRADKLF